MEAARAILQWKRGDWAVLVLFSLFPSIIFCFSFTLLSNKGAKKSAIFFFCITKIINEKESEKCVSIFLSFDLKNTSTIC